MSSKKKSLQQNAVIVQSRGAVSDLHALQLHRLPTAIPPDIRFSDYQKYAFDYFRRKATIQLERNMSSARWTRLALQLSTETPVFHAVAALGSSYRTLVQLTHAAFACPSVDDTEALDQSCTAIASLRRHLDGAVSRTASLESVLMACLLLLTLELVRGNSAAVLSHLRFGRKAARECVQSGNDRSLGIKLEARSTVTTRELMSMFNQLEAHCVLSPQIPGRVLYSEDRPGYRPSTQLPSPLTTVEDVRTQLDILIVASHRLRMDVLQIAQSALQKQEHKPNCLARRTCINQCLSRTINLDQHPDIITRLHSLTVAFSAWLTKLSEILFTQHKPDKRRALTFLQIRHFHSTFLLSTCRETREQRSDFFSADWARVLDLAEEYLAAHPVREDNRIESLTSHPGPRPNFTIDTGVLPTLYLICLKCRDSAVRRRALQVLRRTDRLEGFLQSQTLANHAECIIDLEERHARLLIPLLDDTTTSEDGSALTADQVPEAARILDAVVAAAPTKPTEMHVVCGRIAHERDGELEVVEYRFTGCPMVLYPIS
ncbi:hypothetical protein LTR97_001055 [Elasticomyces elasticus]|uniref:Uncharacterized protein n=1 Tax=Elasticomyces elasticus TaxID=574655 RepID=A0AAN7WFL4_9PEZI|nr:hypothetical protein LTR97_001055 [Elasticomyces elasticus]